MRATILQGDCRTVLAELPEASVHCVVTSPPYFGLRDYGHPGQIGMEQTPAEYVAALVDVFRQVRRVLRPDGVLWLNLGDSYAGGGCGSRDPRLWPKQSRNDHMPAHAKTRTGLKEKDLCGVPWRTALALQDDGWWLRADCIWDKPNAMPSSVDDRPSLSHEYVFLLAKSQDYFYDRHAILEPFADARQGRDGGRQPSERNRGGRTDGFTKPNGIDPSHNGGRNKRSVWRVSTAQYKGAHYATFPPALITPMILAGTSERGCCSACLTPWERIVGCETEFRGNSARAGRSADDLNSTGKWRNGGASGNKNLKMGPVSITSTVGWRPTCGCDAGDPIPCTVLDPFAGSGTVGAVATKLGRHSVLIELNEDYAAQCERRNAQFGLSL